MPQPIYGQTKDEKRIPILVDEKGKFQIKIPLWHVIFAIALQVEIIVAIIMVVLK